MVTATVPEASTVPLTLTLAEPVAVNAPLVTLTEALKPLMDATKSFSLGNSVTELAPRLTVAESRLQLAPDLVAFNCEIVTDSEVNSIHL